MKKLADIELKNLRGGAQSDQPPAEPSGQAIPTKEPVEEEQKN